MLKKVMISFLFAFIIFVSLCSNICNAISVKVTKENLSEAFKELMSTDIKEDNIDIIVEDDGIKVTIDSEVYNMSYNLTGKPTFVLEIPIEKGMTYEEFEKKRDNLILPIYGYVAVARVQGVELEDASAYISLNVLGNTLNGFSFSTGDGYVIVDDMKDGTIEKTDDPKTIYTSEFGDRVIEYVNYLFAETQTITDANETDSFVMTRSKKDVTETSCKLVTTLTVNLDADFSKLKGIYDKVSESFMDKNITKDNADFVVTLKVGQKCKIETEDDIKGYSISGNSCVEWDKDKTEFTATGAGKANGSFNVGDKIKTFYITVEENKDNDTLETIVLKIKDKTNTGMEANKENNIQKLPETGEEKNVLLIALYSIISICSISLIILLVISKRKK